MWPGHNLLPLVETGLTGLPKPRWTIAHSVHSSPTWGYIFNQLLSIEAERLLISKYEFSLSIPHCASLPLTNLDEAMTEIPKSRKDLFSHHLRIKSFTHVHLIWFSLFCLVLIRYRSAYIPFWELGRFYDLISIKTGFFLSKTADNVVKTTFFCVKGNPTWKKGWKRLKVFK